MSYLVSIVVITYNSSKFIFDALNSIKAQTYENIELIISDDASSDNTLELCQNWIVQNKSRFVRTEVLMASKNTGISANCNRGLMSAKGDWIKFCAGDDALLPNCIKDNIQYVTSHSEVRVLFSYAKMYLETFDEINYIRLIPNSPPLNIINKKITAREQYNLLLLSDRITFTTTSFFHKNTLIQVRGFDEQVKTQEDYPLWLNLTQAGYKLNFMQKETIKYRKHALATNNLVLDYLIKPNYFKTEPFRRKIIYPNLPWDVRYSMRFEWYGSQIFRLNTLNKNRKPNRIIWLIFTSWINPFKYLSHFKKYF